MITKKTLRALYQKKSALQVSNKQKKQLHFIVRPLGEGEGLFYTVNPQKFQ